MPLAVCGVYIWWRGETPLYVGMSVSMLARIGAHHVIGKAEPIQADDEIEFRECIGMMEARDLEGRLIKEWRPRFNKSGNPNWYEVRGKEAPKKCRSDRDGIYKRQGVFWISLTGDKGKRVQRKLKGVTRYKDAVLLRNLELARIATQVGALCTPQ